MSANAPERPSGQLRGRRTRAPERPSGQAGLPEPRSGDQTEVLRTTLRPERPSGPVRAPFFFLRYQMCSSTLYKRSSLK